MPKDALAPPAGLAPYTDPRAAFEHFTRRLIGLARIHLRGRLEHKIDPEDVVQSAYKSCLLRCGEGAIEAEGWEGLWGLLTQITIRKCADRARYYQAECRDLGRETESPELDSNPAWLEIAGREPTPEEAAVLAETVADLLAQLSGRERMIVELSLQGYSTQEICAQTGRAERSVRRVRERVRIRLAHQ
ncbi:MAG: sigma-70 family RNA polymerase sigma factor [Planctomycetaceae bacterium]|nr:sigma-70 family RNA polymerase sigma factor [Planctomycetaceae bacterium]